MSYSNSAEVAASDTALSLLTCFCISSSGFSPPMEYCLSGSLFTVCSGHGKREAQTRGPEVFCHVPFSKGGISRWERFWVPSRTVEELHVGRAWPWAHHPA